MRKTGRNEEHVWSKIQGLGCFDGASPPTPQLRERKACPSSSLNLSAWSQFPLKFFAASNPSRRNTFAVFKSPIKARTFDPGRYSFNRAESRKMAARQVSESGRVVAQHRVCGRAVCEMRWIGGDEVWMEGVGIFQLHECVHIGYRCRPTYSLGVELHGSAVVAILFRALSSAFTLSCRPDSSQRPLPSRSPISTSLSFSVIGSCSWSPNNIQALREMKATYWNKIFLLFAQILP
ncbi:hypothetical protein BC830DRAFT_364072 [Chytriomyces sp. MP71]|nr:hypothetical protein BC830DRAFT_364072 [Chytriomyces sp. MP71]